jgi:hypothetical protein
VRFRCVRLVPVELLVLEGLGMPRRTTVRLELPIAIVIVRLEKAVVRDERLVEPRLVHGGLGAPAHGSERLVFGTLDLSRVAASAAL